MHKVPAHRKQENAIEKQNSGALRPPTECVDAHRVGRDSNNDPRSESVRSSHLFSWALKSTNGANRTDAVAGKVCARVSEVLEANFASSPDMSETPRGRSRAMNRRAAAAITTQTQNQIISHRGAPPSLIVGVEESWR